jgi:aminoacyl tRNA synthase complex-interacting multifunctional protein 1
VSHHTTQRNRPNDPSLTFSLKPVKMRGVTSQGMVLCASAKDGKDAGGIEFVSPPEGSQPGERIYFEGEKYESESRGSNFSIRGD